MYVLFFSNAADGYCVKQNSAAFYKIIGTETDKKNDDFELRIHISFILQFVYEIITKNEKKFFVLQRVSVHLLLVMVLLPSTC
jgi:hypothetical protein